MPRSMCLGHPAQRQLKAAIVAVMDVVWPEMDDLVSE